MLSFWRWILVITERVDSVTPASETARVSVQPGSPRVDDDVAPEFSSAGHVLDSCLARVRKQMGAHRSVAAPDSLHSSGFAAAWGGADGLPVVKDSIVQRDDLAP